MQKKVIGEFLKINFPTRQIKCKSSLGARVSIITNDSNINNKSSVNNKTIKVL